uniref:Birch protein n=1 Tax=Betula platyphylla TaxID=78630 RepID=A0A9E9L6D0_BETPL|nr:birch protein [Betula platyphylla]
MTHCAKFESVDPSRILIEMAIMTVTRDRSKSGCGEPKADNISRRYRSTLVTARGRRGCHTSETHGCRVAHARSFIERGIDAVNKTKIGQRLFKDIRCRPLRNNGILKEGMRVELIVSTHICIGTVGDNMENIDPPAGSILEPNAGPPSGRDGTADRVGLYLSRSRVPAINRHLWHSWLWHAPLLLPMTLSLQDFCVAVNSSTDAVFFNGKFCKDPKLVTPNDFFFAGLNTPRNTSNQLGSNVTLLMIFIVVEGTLYVGFVTSENSFFTKTLHAGDLFVSPIGLTHFQINVGTTNAVAFASLSSQNPGLVVISENLFGANPPINPKVLVKAFQVDTNVVESLQKKFS